MNIINLTPQGLDALADQIKDDLERREQGKDQWVEATISLCQHLAEARGKFRDNISFGQWFDDSGIQINEHDRAAAIAMGKQIEIARQVLEKTERRSLKHIHGKEFNRLVHVDKTPKPKKTNEKLEKALHAYDRRKQAGEELTYEAIQKEAGVSSTPVRRAIAMREAEAKVSVAETAGLSASAQEKLQIAIRREMKRLELEVETRVLNEAQKRIEEWYLPDYMKLLRKVEKMLEYKRGLMSRADYRKILRCVHPDTGAHVSDANRNEAFRLFTQLEARLVDDAEQADLKRVSTLPKTVEEMLARRKTKAGR
jgi:hypothetical protein